MIVNNTTLFVKTLPIREADGKIRDEIVLLPGTNDVPDAKWNKVAHAEPGDKSGLLSVAQWLDEGVLVELDSTPLGKRPVAEAVKIVKATVNLDLLEKWREDEKRPAVSEAIVKAIKAASMTPDEEKKAKEGKKT